MSNSSKGQPFLSLKIFSIFFILFCTTSAYSIETKTLQKVSPQFLKHSWHDQNDEIFKFNDSKSELYAVAIAYTTCKSVCPMVTQQIATIRKSLAEKKISFPYYFISIDPKRDDSQQRKNFLKKFGDDLDWKFLVTTPESTHQLVGELGMGFSDPQGSNHAMHTLTLAILNRKGEILVTVAVLPEETKSSVEKIISGIIPKP